MSLKDKKNIERVREFYFKQGVDFANREKRKQVKELKSNFCDCGTGYKCFHCNVIDEVFE